MPLGEVEAFYGRPDVVAAYERSSVDAAEQRLVDECFPPGGAILDVGTGRGRVALFLARRGFRATGVDLSEPMVEAAARDAAAGGLEAAFLRADVQALPFPDGSFDGAIFAGNGLSHLEPDEQPRALRELARVLRPAATLVLPVRTPYALNRLLPGLVWRAATGNGGRRPHESVSRGVYVDRPSLRELRRLLLAAGFADVRVRGLRDARAGRPGSPLTRAFGGQFFLLARHARSRGAPAAPDG